MRLPLLRFLRLRLPPRVLAFIPGPFVTVLGEAIELGTGELATGELTAFDNFRVKFLAEAPKDANIPLTPDPVFVLISTNVG